MVWDFPLPGAFPEPRPATRGSGDRWAKSQRSWMPWHVWSQVSGFVATWGADVLHTTRTWDPCLLWTDGTQNIKHRTGTGNIIRKELRKELCIVVKDWLTSGVGMFIFSMTNR